MPARGTSKKNQGQDSKSGRRTRQQERQPDQPQAISVPLGPGAHAQPGMQTVLIPQQQMPYPGAQPVYYQIAPQSQNDNGKVKLYDTTLRALTLAVTSRS